MDMTEDELCRLKVGVKEVGDHCILPDGFRVSITTQREGEPSSQSVTIPIKQFNQLIRWYVTPQEIPSK